MVYVYISIALFLIWIANGINGYRKVKRALHDHYLLQGYDKKAEEAICDLKEMGINDRQRLAKIINKLIEAIDNRETQITQHLLVHKVFLVRSNLFLKNTKYDESLVNDLTILQKLFYHTFGYKVIYDGSNVKTNEIDIRVNHHSYEIRDNDVHLVITICIRTQFTDEKYQWNRYFSK